LPSSLARVLPSALEFSSHPPESVYGTVSTAFDPREAFPGSMGSLSFGPGGPPHHLSTLGTRLWPSPPTLPAYWLEPEPTPGSATLLRPFSRKHPCWCRNIRLLPIDYAFLPRLRGRLTLGRLSLPRNPWVFGDRVFHPVYRYSRLHYHF
jgi:hypothetical protein